MRLERLSALTGLLTALTIASTALSDEKKTTTGSAPAAAPAASKPAATPAASKPAAKGSEANPAVVDSKMEILRQKIKSDKKYIVSENLDLTDDEAKGFWPVYDRYQAELQKLNQRIEGLVSTYLEADAKGPITNPVSKKIVADLLEIEQAELDAKKSVLGKLAKVLPAYKVAKYAQLENKMRALVKYELAVNIPLVE